MDTSREKQLYRYFKQQTIEIAHEMIWTWLRRGNLKRESKSLLTVSQNIIRTSYIQTKSYNMLKNIKCRLYSDRDINN